MIRAVVDTHALVWFLARPKRLGKSALRHLKAAESGRAIAIVPSIALAELAFLRDRGRRVLGVAEVETTLAKCRGIAVTAFGAAEAHEFALLGNVADPFDRMMIATARAAGCPLITADKVIVKSGLVDVLWN
jgi:PIN domain nuclease of toxin-antitoxin system